MTAESLSNGTIGSLGLQNQGRNWVTKGSTRNVNDQYSATRTSQTKLLFNEAIPLSAINRATRVGPPAPIVIERLLPCSEMRESVGSLKHSCNFSVLSEERLQAAVKLAKRDLRRRHFESLAKTSAKPLQESSVFETSDVKLLQELIASPGRTQLKEKKAQTDVKQQTSKKKATSVMARVGQSPPTRDPGLRQLEAGKQGHLSSEILKLHNELETCIRKVEELAHRGEKTEESLEPEEQNKWEIRRQKQAANSARTIYVLQRQVKEIQDDIEKLRREKMWDEKKSVAINRLAAAHRGALRALQVVIHQLSDQAQTKVHPHYKELGQLIRQLSLCSAKVEVDQGSDVPQTALDILQKLEILDSALSKHDMLEKMQARAHPPPRKSPHRSTSPTSGPKSLSVFTAQGHRKPPNPRGGRSFALQRPKKVPNQPLNKRELLTVGLQSIIQQRELKQPLRQSQPNTKYQRRRHAERKKASKTKPNQMQEAGFQQPTVSSQLRVNQMPQKEKSVPWMPTSPHSPPQQRVPQRGRPEPRCLFSPIKPSASPPGEQQAEGQLEAERNQSSPKMKAAHNEAIRRAYQEKMTKQRVTRLSGEEVTPKHRLRSEVALQNQWAEEAEQGVRERSQGLSNRIQQEGAARNRPDKLRKIQLPEVTAERAVGDCGWLGESVGDLLEDSSSDSWAAGTGRRLDDKAGFGQQAPTLESMLLRMEEIQRDEEEVRRRFASIAYSDTLYWDRSRTAGSQAQAPRSRPASPQPIRLTRPVLKQTSAADIFLEKPIEAGTLFEKNLTEDLMVQPLATNRVSSDKLEKNMTVLSVPCSTLKNIRRYKEDYNTYLQSVSHGVKDSFNTWVITESLAEEILSEALVDVAKEFQEVVEEYAEAIFTSEFLQPIQSPPASALSS